MWVRAVWKEGEMEEEGVIPDIWVQGKCVFWPPGVAAAKALRERWEPTERWRKFKLIKIKLTASKILY